MNKRIIQALYEIDNITAWIGRAVIDLLKDGMALVLSSGLVSMRRVEWMIA